MNMRDIIFGGILVKFLSDLNCVYFTTYWSVIQILMCVKSCWLASAAPMQCPSMRGKKSGTVSKNPEPSKNVRPTPIRKNLHLDVAKAFAQGNRYGVGKEVPGGATQKSF